MWAALSVDLEPNKDDTFDGIRDAMDWFNTVVPRGTVFATYRIATELPDLLTELNAIHEIGVHVHPREFGHEDDELAALSQERQAELVEVTQGAIADALNVSPSEITSFRAGRHSANHETLAVLADLGFAVDASVNVRYGQYLPDRFTQRRTPYKLNSGLLELPTSFTSPRLVSRIGLDIFPQRTLTATAATLRSDGRFATGLEKLNRVVHDNSHTVHSMYMHPYDATEYHDLENVGPIFRTRFETFLSHNFTFLTVTEAAVRATPVSASEP